MIYIDGGYTKIEAYTRGRKEKTWFEKDGQRYLYKYGANNYEIYAELIAEQLGKQVDISMASYRAAQYHNTVGVLTRSFIKPDELMVSSDKLKIAVQLIYEENNINKNLQENTISNLIEVACTYDPTISVDKLFDELVKRWMFYGLIMESDKNKTNISYIKKGSKLRLSPDYDNSTMARLNENIKDLIMGTGNSPDIYNLTDDIKQSLKPTENSSEYFLDSFREFVYQFPEKTEVIFSSFESMDVNMAIKKVEQLNKIEVPWEVKFLLNKIIPLRYQDMRSIIEQNKIGRKNTLLFHLGGLNRRQK
ncbi:MAG: hypothetical protein HFJ12_03035 [Bacilli bacterium]|nr:hypothetical protein [Bacilli bacterium]